MRFDARVKRENMGAKRARQKNIDANVLKPPTCVPTDHRASAGELGSRPNPIMNH